MSCKQLVTPNLDPVIYQPDKNGNLQPLQDWFEWCLAYVQFSFKSGWAGQYATDAWDNHMTRKHTDRNIPAGVYVVIYFSGYHGQGHMAIYKDGRVWCTPNKHGMVTAEEWDSIESVERNYGVTYVGWSEDIGGTRVVEYIAEAAPTPAPAPANFTAEVKDIPARHVVVDPGVHEWDLNQPDWDHVISSPVAGAPGGQIVVVAALVRSDFPQHTYLLTDKNVHHGFNSADCHDVSISTTYDKLESPIDLSAANDPTTVWHLDFADYSTAAADHMLALDAPFTAYGKAQRIDYPGQPMYFMTKEDFGDADVSGHPTKNVGVNSVDVKPAPTPPVEVPNIASSTPPMSTVTPVAPVVTTPAEIDWKASERINDAQYQAKESKTIVDLDNPENSPLQLNMNQTIRAARRFMKDNVWYVRTQKSVDNGWYYAVPMSSLELVKAFDIDPADGGLLDDLDMGELVNQSKKVATVITNQLKNNKTLREKIVSALARLFYRPKKQK
jgi:hypothetical protein